MKLFFIFGINSFVFISTVIASIVITLFTIIGSTFVLLIKKKENKYLPGVYGLCGGIMCASAIFSLLLPSLAEWSKRKIGIFYVLGFVVLGMFVMLIIDVIISKRLKDIKKDNILLVIAMTLHNIPEGVFVGIAYALISIDMSYMKYAILITIAVASQNILDGFVLTLPLTYVFSKKKALIVSSLSGSVEILGAIIGLVMATYLSFSLPLIMSMFGGVIIYVIVAELIPEMKKSAYGFLFFFLGFILMMILDLYI